MTKRMTRFYTAWAYHKNEQDLDRRSASGWRLTKPGLTRFTFEPDETPYRYRLDYCPALLGEKEIERRRSLCEEQGWRLAGATPTEWLYWEKPFDPSLPEGAYELPLRRTPEQEKLVGPISLFFWLRIFLVAVGLILAVIAIVRQKQMFVTALLYIACILVLFFRMQALQEKLK